MNFGIRKAPSKQKCSFASYCIFSLFANTENTTVLLDGNLMGNDVIVRHSGNGMTKEDITLQCNITVPRSTVSITWFHNGEQNHSLSTDSIHFPSNSHVSAIAGTYVCAASTSNWETRVQFRIFLKRELIGFALACSLLLHPGTMLRFLLICL